MDQNTVNADPLEHMLDRSNALHERIGELLGTTEFDGAPRSEVVLGMCVVAMEHGTPRCAR